MNTPTLLNRLFSIRQFLDTRSSNLLDQVAGPISNPLEMGGDLDVVMQIINKSNWKPGVSAQFVNVLPGKPILPPIGIRTYQRWFCLAFNGNPDCDTQFKVTDLKEALAVYELTLTKNKSPIDNMKLGLSYQDAISRNGYSMSLSEGYRLFQGKGRCIGCHSGSNFSDELLHQSGPLFESKPAGIKTPTLRGLSLTFPYFHDGSDGLLTLPSWCQFLKSDSNEAGKGLCKVVEFYNLGACRMKDTIPIRSYANASAPPQISTMDVSDISCDPESVSLGLSPQEKRNLVEFLLNL